MFQATEMSWEQALRDQEPLGLALDAGLPTQKGAWAPTVVPRAWDLPFFPPAA